MFNCYLAVNCPKLTPAPFWHFSRRGRPLLQGVRNPPTPVKFYPVCRGKLSIFLPPAVSLIHIFWVRLFSRTWSLTEDSLIQYGLACTAPIHPSTQIQVEYVCRCHGVCIPLSQFLDWVRPCTDRTSWTPCRKSTRHLSFLPERKKFE